jgi:L-ascorbate metabolism protein UlaG (beta-lactamase superfamily)
VAPPDRVTWLGHSTVALELDGVRLLTDPVLSRRVVHLRRVVEPPRDLPAADAVLVSHAHYDHLDLRTLRRLGGSPRVVVPRGLGSMLRFRGLKNVVEVVAGDETQVGAVTVRATHAYHSGWRPGAARGTAAVGYAVLASFRIFFAGDTGLFPELESLVPELDVAFLPVGGWGPKLPDDHLDPEGAARAVALLRPRIAVPIHWGTYLRVGMRDDEPRGPAEEFVRAAAEHAPGVRVVVLGAGESLELRRP